jgi:hypothetical protein
MKTFLNEARRHKLMHALTHDLGMPIHLATQFVYLPDDPLSIDYSMTGLAEDVVDLAKAIVQIGPGDPDKLAEKSTFLACDLAILAAYKAEASERGVLGGFVHWVEACKKMGLVIQ